MMKKPPTFKTRNSDEIYHIHKPLNCNSENTVYLIECNHCWKQYTGSYKTKFCYRANNYKSTHRKFKNKKQVLKEALKQKIFHEHFCSDDHSGIQDWVITLFEQVDDEKFFRQKEHFWVHKLDTFYPNSFNYLRSLLITRITFNRFSHCEDIFLILCTFEHYYYLH